MAFEKALEAITLSHKYRNWFSTMKRQRIRAHRRHVPQGCPMGSGQTAVTGKNSPRWAGSAVARCPRSARRCALDSAHVSSLAGLAARISAIPNQPWIREIDINPLLVTAEQITAVNGVSWWTALGLASRNCRKQQFVRIQHNMNPRGR